MTASRSGRIACPRCGANNFESVSACWKCSAPLTAASPVPSAPASGGYVGSERAAVPSAPFTAPAPSGDSGVAARAAIALALTFPWIGLPVGWVFMMIEDRRKQAIGRICAVWSMIALVFHLLLMFAFMSAVGGFIREVMGISSALKGQGTGGTPSLPNLDGDPNLPTR